MEEQLADLRRQLAEANAQREEEQGRREAAEAIARQSKPMNLIDFLQRCHTLSIGLQVVTDETLTTKGDTTKSAGRPFPREIVPWHDFSRQQEATWAKLSSPHFTSQEVYPSAHQLAYVSKYLDPISSELGLRQCARDTVEVPVRTVINEIYQDEQLRGRFELGGALMFESHTNLGKSVEPVIEGDLEQLSISGLYTSTEGQEQEKDARKTKRSIAQGKSRRIVGTADQFCIYEQADGRRVPVVLIEYKAPHKLPLAEIIAGLQGEIRPSEDVINKEGDDLEFLSKSLLAAVVTQLFSAMIGKGVQRGYVFTGEATIFLFIPDDPTTVQYHLSIPSLDFQESDPNRFHRTSVAQITAFTLGAAAAKAPGQSWHDAAARLDTWAVEYIDILKKIPETIRKAPRHSSYKSRLWQGFNRSPIRTRARARRVASVCNDVTHDILSSSEEDNDEGPPSPTPSRAGRVLNQKKLTSAQQVGEGIGLGTSGANEQDSAGPSSRPRLEDRPYCTHHCLLGLASSGALDLSCPNFAEHGRQHLQLEAFLDLVRTQLAEDRGRDADCKPLFIKGSRGALVKIRLSSHGYTFVGKAMEDHNRQHLLHEAKVYGRLRSLQGSQIPVCLSTLDLKLPFHYDCGTYLHMLLLSWAGRSLYQHLNKENKVQVLHIVGETLAALHKHHVLHRDPETRNWLWDVDRSSVMLVDFERAEIRDRPALSILDPNRKRKRQGNLKGVTEDISFYREIQDARRCISRCVT